MYPKVTWVQDAHLDILGLKYNSIPNSPGIRHFKYQLNSGITLYRKLCF